MKRIVAALLLSCAVPARADEVGRWRPHVEEASARFGVPVAWIERVMDRESGGARTLAGRPIISSAGAMGLMQLMPSTWRAMRGQLGLGSDPHDPRDNILAGVRYLRLMYDRFGYPGLFGAYNAGPARYAEHLQSGRPLPAETRAYVAALANGAERSAAPAYRISPAVKVAPVVAVSHASGAPEGAGVPGGAIFFPLRTAVSPNPR